MNSTMVFDEGSDKTTVVEIDNVETFSEYEKENIFDNKVRKAWHKQEEEWYFSVVDICAILTEQESANIEQILRIIQSIPSKKAEPFKEWLAKVGAERLDEIADPEKAMERAVATYKAKGYSDKWISQRLRSIEIRKELKGLKKENLRDNMTNTELALNLLAEVSTTELSRM